MQFSINKFFEKNECNKIIEFAEKFGVKFLYNPNDVWDCKRIYDDEFKKNIIEKFKNLYQNGKLNIWFDLNSFQINDINISLTKYYDGRWLDLHKDASSQFTTVILLSENFTDGRFVLSEKYTNIHNCEKYKITIGEAISFNGSTTFHGVMPVVDGVRYALNIWMTNTDFKYYKLDKGKKLL